MTEEATVTKMLRTIIVSSDSDLNRQLKSALEETGRSAVVRVVDPQTEASKLADTVRRLAPELIFVNSDNRDLCLDLAAEAGMNRATEVVAVGRNFDPELLSEASTLGVREFLAFPFEHALLAAALIRIARSRRPSARLSASERYNTGDGDTGRHCGNAYRTCI